jgi:hypothetical protein
MIEYTVKVYPNGGKFWYLNKWWYLNDKLHREDGPAVEGANGDKWWYLNDEEVTEEEHKRLTSKVIEMTMGEINKALGKQVKVVE